MPNAAEDRASSTPGDTAVEAAQAVYTPLTLPLYDVIVHGLSNRFAWRCPTERLVALYRSNQSSRHLEAGCGTGYFINRVDPDSFERLVLLDANRHCLARSAARLARYRPETQSANLLQPFEIAGGRFDSIALTYVLHCLPGTLDWKLRAVDYLRALLLDGGVLFGATILGRGINPNAAARTLLGAYNAKGVFNNRGDDMYSLDRGLRDRFNDVRIERIGCVALFECR
jgi:SAM-dependent methyltransferase